MKIMIFFFVFFPKLLNFFEGTLMWVECVADLQEVFDICGQLSAVQALTQGDAHESLERAKMLLFLW